MSTDKHLSTEHESGPDGIDTDVLQRLFGRHLALYKTRRPVYQAEMLRAMRSLWRGEHARLLDVGAGTGVVAQAVAELFPVRAVEAVDIVDRFCPTLSISAQKYDGRTLPFTDAAFDAAMLNNVMHHVPLEGRVALLREIRRVTRGPLYIKDHETRGALDTLRLTTLDAIGNIPFGGMLWARYLTREDWDSLAQTAGYRITARVGGRYRSQPFRLLFPNRLEATMRLEPA